MGPNPKHQVIPGPKMFFEGGLKDLTRLPAMSTRGTISSPDRCDSPASIVAAAAPYRPRDTPAPAGDRRPRGCSWSESNEPVPAMTPARQDSDENRSPQPTGNSTFGKPKGSSVCRRPGTGAQVLTDDPESTAKHRLSGQVFCNMRFPGIRGRELPPHASPHFARSWRGTYLVVTAHWWAYRRAAAVFSFEKSLSTMSMAVALSGAASAWMIVGTNCQPSTDAGGYLVLVRWLRY